MSKTNYILLTGQAAHLGLFLCLYKSFDKKNCIIACNLCETVMLAKSTSELFWTTGITRFYFIRIMSNNQITNSAKAVQIYQNPQFGDIRTSQTENNEPLFCLADVCKAIGITNPRNVKSRLDEEDVHLVDTPTSGGIQSVTFITESGLYDVILRSDSVDAKPFRKWVTSEVLPAIRKTGGYMVAKQDDTPEEIMARALMIATKTIERSKSRITQLESQTEMQRLQLQESAPKVEYYDNILMSNSTYNINAIAKELGMSAVTLNKELYRRGVQYRQGQQWLLYSKYQDKGYTKTHTHSFTRSDGSLGSAMSTVWTEKGREFILKLMSC